MFFSCQLRTVGVAVLDGKNVIAVAVVVAVEVAVWAESNSGR